MSNYESILQIMSAVEGVKEWWLEGEMRATHISSVGFMSPLTVMMMHSISLSMGRSCMLRFMCMHGVMREVLNS